MNAIPGLSHWGLSKLLREARVTTTMPDGRPFPEITSLHEDWAGVSLPMHANSLAFYRREMQTLSQQYEELGESVPGHKMHEITAECWRHFYNEMEFLRSQKMQACSNVEI